MRKKPIVVYLKITIGVMLIALAYYFLYLPQNLVIGGVTGIATIIKGIFPNLSTAILIYIFNGVLLVVGWFFIGKDFFLKTIYGSLLLPTLIFLLEVFNINPSLLFSIDKYLNIDSVAISLTSRLIISMVLGSLMTGIGLGICFKNNASTGGMDIVQKMVVKTFRFQYSKIVYLTDGIIVLISLFVFGVEKTFYSLIAVVLVGIIIDYIQIGGFSRRTAFIISDKNEEIKTAIMTKMNRGVTIIPAIGAFDKKHYNMLVCTHNKSESYVMRQLIYEIDLNAFTFYVSAKEVYGDGFE